MEENNSTVGVIALMHDGNDSESPLLEHWLL